jgi:hypothetical protein
MDPPPPKLPSQEPFEILIVSSDGGKTWHSIGDTSAISNSWILKKVREVFP